MYFATGWPRVLQSPLEEGDSLSDAQRSPDGRYLAILSNSALLLWSGGQQRLLLACCAFEEGIQVAWAPDSRRLAVLDVRGLVRLLLLSPRAQPFEYRFTGPSTGLSLGFDQSHLLLQVKQKGNALDHAGLASAITSAAGRLLIATRCGSIVIVNWSGIEEAEISLSTILSRKSLSETEIECDSVSGAEKALKVNDNSDSDPQEEQSVPQGENCHVVRLIASADLLLTLMEDGSVAVIPLPSLAQIGGSEHLSGRLQSQLIALEKGEVECAAERLVRRGATAVAYSSKHKVVAVGHSSGEISLFQEESGAEIGSAFDILRMFSLVHWGISPEDVGAVRDLRWSPDGSVLASAWQRRGAAVWSVHGCRLMCTVPQLEGCKVKGHHRCHSQTHSNGDTYHKTHNCSRKEEKARAREALSHGTAALEWGAEGYWLFAGACGKKGTGKGAELLQISFVKSALVGQPNLNYSPRLVLMGEDRLLLLEKRHQDLNDVRWAELPLPHAYLADNWPLRRVAVSRRGTDLAVAGRRGLCLYSTTGRRWRLFGDQRKEQEIVCCGLAWFRTSVLVASAAPNGRHELLAFPRNHLAISSRLLRQELPVRRKPTALDCNDRHLVLYTQDGFFFHYSIAEVYDKDGALTALHLQLLHQVTTTNPASLSSLLLLPAAPIGSPHEAGAQCLLLDGSGRLCVSSPESGREAEICANTEQFWYGGTASRAAGGDAGHLSHDSELANSLWAYGEGGLHVWFPFLPAGGGHEELQRRLEGTGEDLLTRDVSLEFDLEVYPVGFVPELGVVVGLSQGLRHSEASPYPQFVVRTRTHPFLHSVLRHILLEQQNFQHALAVATRHSSIPHFQHSLELLLHESLEACQGGGSTGGTKEVTRRKSALVAVVDFLKTFQEYPEIVVRCARKTDASHWPLLFSIAGEPLSLFQACIARGFLASAASYLRVLHLLSGTMQARKSAYALLEALLAAEDFSLLPDLLAFLSPERLQADGEAEVLSSSGPSHRRTASPAPTADEESYLQDMVLARHARKLLAAGNLRLLLLFAKKTNRELRPWLLRERDRAAALESISMAISLIHTQFDVPLLEAIPEACRELRLVSPQTNASDEDSGTAEIREYYPQPSPRLGAASTPNAPLSPARLPSLSRMSLADAATEVKSSLKSGYQAPLVQETRATGITFIQKPSDTQKRRTGPLRIPLAAQRQLELLLLELYSAQCMEWALVIACVLLNVPVIQEILQTRPRLRNTLAAALAHQKSGAYSELRTIIVGT